MVAAPIDHMAAVNQVEILIAIAVPVEKSATGAIGLGQALCRRGAIFVDVVDTHLPRHLHEADLTRRRDRRQQ